jgi:uncharacterized protein YqeY
MSALKDTIDSDLRDAMRAHDETRKTALRLLITGIRNAEIPPELKNADPTPEGAMNAPQRIELTDEDVLNVVRKEVKQRRDSIEAYTKANRSDLASIEEAELAVLLTYLPPQMSPDEIEAVARQVIDRVGARGPADKGRVMGPLMSELRGKADGAQINAAVTKLLGAMA